MVNAVIPHAELEETFLSMGARNLSKIANIYQNAEIRLNLTDDRNGWSTSFRG